MTRILDTTPDFLALVRAAFLEDRVTRRDLWDRQYRSLHPEVFEAFFAGHGDEEQIPAVVHRMSDVRKVVEEAAPVMAELVEDVEPGVRDTLELADLPEPLHVLMVGTFSTNAFVARMGDDVAVLHCLEWFSDPDTARVLVAHEDTHAWHETLLGHRSPTDLAWTAFAEGLAVQVSRTAVPDRPEEDYFWYGVGGFEDWLPWCREHRGLLLERFREGLEEPDSADPSETFFGSGFVEQHWRTGFFLADELVGQLDASLPELVRMGVDEGRDAIRAAVEGMAS